MKNRVYGAFLVSSMALVLTACNDEALLTSGTFQADVMSANDGTTSWAPAPTLSAKVSRENETVVFTLADGTSMSVNIKALPEEQWGGGCATMGSYVVQEVVRLSPAPITLADMTFAEPVLETQCSPDSIQLHEFGAVDATSWISFERVK